MSDTSDIDYTTPAIIPEDELEARARIEWHVRMARAKQAELADTTRQYQAELDRIKDRLANRTRILNEAIAWHTEPVKSWHEFRLTYDIDKRATVEMVHGISKITTPKKPRIDLIDEHDPDDVVHWLLNQHEDAFSVPNITTLRSYLDVKENDDGTFTVVDKTSGEVRPEFTAAVPDPTYKLTLEQGAPIE